MCCYYLYTFSGIFVSGNYYINNNCIKRADIDFDDLNISINDQDTSIENGKKNEIFVKLFLFLYIFIF